jgi:hypothetical protein
MVALSFSRKALGPVLGGLESKSGSEIRLNPLPTQVPARSARGPKTSGSERLAVDSKTRVEVGCFGHGLLLSGCDRGRPQKCQLFPACDERTLRR